MRYWKRSIVYIANVFKVLQSCEAGSLTGSFSSQIIHLVQCLHVTKLSLWFAQVRSVQNDISKSALHRLVCIIASLLRKKV